MPPNAPIQLLSGGLLVALGFGLGWASKRPAVALPARPAQDHPQSATYLGSLEQRLDELELALIPAAAPAHRDEPSTLSLTGEIEQLRTLNERLEARPAQSPLDPEAGAEVVKDRPQHLRWIDLQTAATLHHEERDLALLWLTYDQVLARFGPPDIIKGSSAAIVWMWVRPGISLAVEFIDGHVVDSGN